MYVSGDYVGLGEGDDSAEVGKVINFILTKFDRFDNRLTPGTVFTPALTAVITELQTVYVGEGKLKVGAFLPGVVNLETKYALGYKARPMPEDKLPVLFTVCGTGVPWWVGPDADTARAVERKYRWQPVGYRAAPFPMGKSVDEGREELVNQFTLHRAQVERFGSAMAGFSQGAIIIALVWELDIRPKNGRLHWAFNKLKKVVAWGNPKRQQGKVYGDANGAAPAADSHGIADELMTDTPDWWRNYGHKGDMYTDVSGESGEMKTSIYKVIMGQRVFSGPDSIIAQVIEIVTRPVIEVIALTKAVMDAGLFFIKKTGPHLNYETAPAVEYLLQD